MFIVFVKTLNLYLENIREQKKEENVDQRFKFYVMVRVDQQIVSRVPA